ncbi:PREDICTED: uncharacterized protein LOC105456906 [Wasmannia auropunctata]|uniref:uncharacterized protein LOC105456906 n=1 Tax=Wasmannia auropunctata TaxID=64793 RepID=UPI0005ED8F77|nr:PREDICTED: uncharacterized protein LOC105456906 [Wasmannia auropunctata]
MIAAELYKENPLWEYTGKQCENKFKDVRRNYVKTKDNNVNKSGQDLQTCKFYDEMDATLGEKPLIKPVAIASSLKKDKRSISSEDKEEEENFKKILKPEKSKKLKNK